MVREVYKKMISYVKKEPLFSKTLYRIVVSLLIINAIALVLHTHFIADFYREKMEIDYDQVGKLAKLYPEDEAAIVESIIGQKDDIDISKGKSIFDKYGYGTNNSPWNVKNYKDKILNFAIKDLLIIILSIAISVFFFMIFIEKIYNRLAIFSCGIDEIMNGKFSCKLETAREGILSKLGTQMNQMSRRIELSLSSLEKEKENIKSLVTDISHQLKTPLSSIKMFNAILMEEKLSVEEQEEFLERSNKEIVKLQGLVDSLIKISRLEIGMIELQKEKRDIRETILEAVNGVYLKALKKNIQVNLEGLKEFYIPHDPRWTKEAIFNILDNAVKYSNENGEIKIVMSETEFYLKIDISDTGIGIHKDEFNNIFKRFYRGKDNIVKEKEGSGIGLYLTRKILEDQGGSIMVDSVVGEGSRFSIYLQNCK